MAKSFAKSFYIQSASFKKYFAHFTKRYNSEDISIQEQELNTQTSCDKGWDRNRFKFAHGGGGTHTSSLNTLSTSNKIIPWDKRRSDTCVIPGNLLQQRGPLGTQLAYLQRLAASIRLILLIEHRRICVVLQDPNKHRFCQQGGKNLAKK